MLCRISLPLVAAFVVLAKQLVKAQAIRPAQPMSELLLGTTTGSGSYTTVRGTVRLAHSNRPLAGVLLSINSCSFGYFGAWDFRFTGDSVRTDGQGRYELRFYSQEGRGYAVLFDPAMGRRGSQPSRYVFYTSSGLAATEDRPDRRLLKSGKVNTVDFAPDFAPNYSQPIDLHLPAVGH